MTKHYKVETFDNNHVVYRMAKDNKPALTCHSGEIIEIHTLDCFSNKLLPEGSRLGVDTLPNNNPCTGPLYIGDAYPGDTLKIEILDIVVGNLGVNLIGPSEVHVDNRLESYEVKRIPIIDGYAEVTPNLKLPVEPMIGVIGVSPKEGSLPTGLPGDHGGNMDCSQIKKGSTVYLPVFVEGALLSIGDLHALMGDGEIGGCGLEIEGKVVIQVTVVSDKTIPGPMVSIDDKWIIIASCNTLEEASVEATNRMLDLLIDFGGVNKEDASLILNLSGHLKICQLVNRLKTVRMELSKECFIDKKLFK
ncbi:MAG: acetamidase/formamidase family protein [Clostridiales bacterium]|nr:acetamidase/formamidase family protein [Clostridiales bacterium]